MLARATVTILLCMVACTSAYIVSKFSQIQIELRSGGGDDDKDRNVQVQIGHNTKQDTDSNQRNGEWGMNVHMQETSPGSKVRIFGNGEQAAQTTPEPTNPTPEVIRGYRRLGDKFFKLVKSPNLDWADARQKCMEDGGDLAVIHSEEEAGFIWALFAEDPSPKDLFIWEGYVGVTDQLAEGQFLTVEGGALSNSGFDRWLPNEPNNGDSRRSHDEDCVTFHKGRAFNDVDCSREMPYFCEAREDKLKREEESRNSLRESMDEFFL